MLESMLCLGNGLPSVSLPVSIPSSSFNSLRIRTKLHSKISHITPLTCTKRLVGQTFHPVVCAMDKFSRNDENSKKIVKGNACASLILACAIGIISAGLRVNPKAIAGPREMYQKAPQVIAHPLGGRAALKSLLDVTVLLTSSKVKPPEASFSLPSWPSMEEVNDIKMQAVRIMKYGKADDAENFLRNAYKNYKYNPEPAYNVEMALAEILICRGKYREALECSCLDDYQRVPSDDRFPLYKAIIYTMLNDTEEATKWWEEYLESVKGGGYPRNI